MRFFYISRCREPYPPLRGTFPVRGVSIYLSISYDLLFLMFGLSLSSPKIRVDDLFQRLIFDFQLLDPQRVDLRDRVCKAQHFFVAEHRIIRRDALTELQTEPG